MKKIVRIILGIVILLSFNVKGWGQVNISAGSTYTQDFNGLGTSPTATLPAGWKVDKDDNSVRVVGSYFTAGTATERSGGDNMSAAGGIYNFAAGKPNSATDRAVGGKSGNNDSKSVNVYVQLKNNGSANINSFTISYNVEKYRKGMNSAGFSIQMYYSTDGTNWTRAGNDFLTSFIPDANSGGYSSAPGETEAVTSKILPLSESLTTNDLIYLAWNYSVTNGITTNDAQALGIDNVSITANETCPTITVNYTSLSGFLYYLGSGPSVEQTLSVSGTDLTADILLTAPTNYEISTNSGTGFTNSITLNQSGGAVATTTIYVRLKAGLSIGNYDNEEITVSSSGASNKTVTCNGSVIDYCFKEDFSGFLSGTHASPSNSDVSGNLDAYTAISGWTGDKVYQAGGEIKLGNASSKGSIITPVLDLSDGDATLYFDAASWDGDNATIIVFHAVDSTNFIQVDSEINLSTSSSTYSVLITGGSVNSKIKIEAKRATKCRFYLDNFKINCAEPISTPVIFVNPDTLSNLDYYLGYGPSEVHTFLVSGKNLTTDISFTAPANYEISTSSGTGFASSLNLSQTGGTVATTTIYVRLKVGLDLGSYNLENIIANSTGADSKTVSCSGSVNLAPVTNLSLICSSNTTAEISWTSPESNYDGVVIAFRQSPTLVPHALSEDPSAINANSVFGSGTQFGTTDPYSYVVYKGTGNSVEVSGLTPGATYKVKAYVYKGTTWLPDIQCPTMTISNLGLSNVNFAQNTDGNSQSELSWVLPSVACFDQILVVTRPNSSVIYTPTGDASTLTADSTFGSGSDLSSNQFVVYKGVGTDFTITGLTNGQTYYAKIFVRKGVEWSTGVELILNPMVTTILEHGDLAILAVNTASDFGDEISIVSFKAIAPNTSIDFTDNGYERLYAGKWGDTEGTIRITRKNSTLDAGKVITFEIKGSSAELSMGADINVYVDGSNDNTNWTAKKLGGSNDFNLAVDDQLWVMQNGNWINSADVHNATYSGNVLYGWTTTIWRSEPGYNNANESTVYPGCECATTNVSGLTNKSKVKYAGSFEPANKFEWISRINNPQNWIGWANNTDFEAGEPKYKNGRSLGITACDAIETKWMGYKSTGWCDCSNWYNLRVPDENADVEITPYNAGRFDLKLCEHVDSLAVCRNLTVKGNIYNTTNATLKVKGNFMLDGGSVNFNESIMNFEIGGNISIDDFNKFKVSKADIKLNGSEVQNINGNSEIVFGTLTVDKSSSHVTISKDIKVDTLNLTKGKITTGNNRVYVNNTATNAITINANNSSCINGNLRRAVAETGSYTFPVGNASNLELATVKLNSSSGLTYLDVRFDNHTTSMEISSLNLRVGGTLLQTLLDVGYWTITPNTELTDINYDIALDMRGATNTGDRATQHTIVKRDNSLSNWYLEGTLDTATQTIDNNVIHAEITGLTSFSQFSIAKNNNTPLPVELISFNAKCNNNFIELNWITATETNSDYFVVQRSNDAINWKNLDKIQGAGTSSSVSKYEYLDIIQVSGNLYYRLMQVDFDGTTTLSNIVNVNCSDKLNNSQIAIYPNPANNILYFSEAQSFKIFDIYGRVLKQSKIEQSSVNISDLNKGMYYIKFENNLLKFVKE